ncbi:hypothetical protein Bbelb_318040 [Branchiostoma belcheri]|nr:hypothetical protein Bbelb_318040 [Branchiostoma belcheri]
MAAPVPVLRGDVTLVGCSLMEVWKKEDEDAAAEREEYREEWAMFEEDMAHLAHLERIMDAEDSSEDEVEEARRLYDQHVQIRFTREKKYRLSRCDRRAVPASLESSVVSKDELQASTELIVSQDRCFASTHVLYVEESLDRTNTDNMEDLLQQLGRAGRTMNQAQAVVYSHNVRRCDKQDQSTWETEDMPFADFQEHIKEFLFNVMALSFDHAFKSSKFRFSLPFIPPPADPRQPHPACLSLPFRRPASCAFLCFDCVSQLRKSSVPKVKGGFGNKRTSATRKIPSKSPGPSKKRRRTAASSYILTDGVRAMDRRQYLKAFRTILNHDAAMRDCA